MHAITTHTCRRSFGMKEFLTGTPVELIMKISGHKSLRDFYKYIRIILEEAWLKLFLIFASSKFLSLWNQSKNQSLKKR